MPRHGTNLDTHNRFTTERREQFDDEWESFADAKQPDPRIELIDDASRTAFATNSSPDIPFTHSINPYRGCSHGCSYCISGDSRILMADGSERPLRDLSVGDAIVGTIGSDGIRVPVQTHILAHWSTVKRAFRITLANGTSLVASGDHRFLTNAGWSFVASAARSSRRRHLSIGDILVGISIQETVSYAVEHQWEHQESSWLPRALVGDRPRLFHHAFVSCDSSLAIVEIEPLDGELELFDITTGTEDFIANGVVSHNCYARPTHEYLGYNAGIDFETKIVVKRDAAKLARMEMMKKSWKPTAVSMSGVTDPYQPIEKKLGITRSILETMLEFRNPVAIVTKNAMVLRDLDLLAEMAKYDGAAVFLSITTLDRDLARRMEPQTSTPERRVEAVRRLTEAGVPVGVMMAPLIPGLTDQEIPALLQTVAEAGARWAYYVMLRLPLAVRPIFLDWLEREEPDKRDKVVHTIEDMRGGELNLTEFGKRMSGTGPRADMIRDLFNLNARKFGLNKDHLELSTEHFRRPGVGGQMGLFE